MIDRITRPMLMLAILPAALAAQGTQSSRFTADDMLDVVSYSVLDVSSDGRWLAATAGTPRQQLRMDYYRSPGDPTYLGPPRGELIIIDTRSGTATKPFAGKGAPRAAQWSPDGTQLLAVLVKPDAEVPEAVIWNRATGRVTPVPVPKTHYVAESGDVRWTPDGREVLLSLRTWEWRRKALEGYKQLVSGPITVMSSRQPFLGWEGQTRLGMQRSVIAVDVARGTTRELIPETHIAGAISLASGSAAISDDGTRLAYNQDTLTRTAYAKLSVPAKRQVRVVVAPGDPRHDRAQRQAKLEMDKDVALSWSSDGSQYVYGKDGRIFAGSLDGGAERQIAGPDTTKPKTPDPTPLPDSVRERRAKESFAVVRYDPRGAWLLASNSEGFWEIDPATASKQIVLRSDTAAGTPLYRFVDASSDGTTFYFSGSMRTQWERGIYRYDRASRNLRPLVKDALRYDGIRLSKDGTTLVYTVSQGSRPGELHAMSSNGGDVRRLTRSNPKLDDPSLARTDLVSYLDADGRRQFGVVYYPIDYQSGRKYPVVLHLYEQFFDEEFEGTNKILNANGYVVLRPSVPSKADPGYVSESWSKAATSAANKLIEMGVADSSRLGVYGCSYGGFATSLLITQTNRFKAAIGIAAPMNLISMYGDSPRLGMRNMAFSEARGNYQLNVGATPWEQPQKYMQNSALMSADRIKTPFLILSGGQDHNVPVGQSSEMFYALRRLGKEVEWVNYVNGGHCTPYSSEEDFKDYNRRIVEWFDRYLKKPATTTSTGVSDQQR